MNNIKLATALDHWLALNPEERDAFERRCGDLAPAMRLRSSDTGALADPAGVAVPCGGAGVARQGLLPLPPGSGQRTPRLPQVSYDPEFFASQAYRRLAETTRLVHVYVASCDGTARLYEASRTTIYKAGTHAGDAVATRMATLNAAAYASWRKSGLALVEEPGFNTWRAERLPIEAPRPHHSPVTPLGTSLAVRLPAAILPERFDVALTQALRPVSIAHLRSEPRITLSLAGIGCDSDRLERYTARRDGTGHKLAAELVRLQPRRDAEALASMVEGIVAALVQEQA